MMAKTMLPIAMLLTLVLGALPAAADRRSHDKREPKIEKVAHKLVRATNELVAEAQDVRRHHRWRYTRALRSLYSLDRHAMAFSERVQRDGAYAHSTQREFRRLARAHREAESRVERLRRSERLQGDWARVDKLMGKLDTKLASLDSRHGRHREQARRYDRWRGAFAWNF
ncbi:MAG: hypothetical protein JRH16_07505 [Deltaproteobacteria bacterium]|nr:hypothetical protein [Deltaproteobacteria bacterium]